MNVSLSRLDVTLVRQPLDNLSNALLDSVFICLNCDFRVRRSLVGGRDAGKLFDFAGASLFVQALGITLLSNLERDVDKDLDERDGLVVVGAGGGGGSMQGAGRVAVGAVGRDEGGNGNGGGVGKQLGNLGDAADVFVAVSLGEAQVLVEAEADVVAVEAVGGDAEVEEVLLEGCCDGGLAGCREAG